MVSHSLGPPRAITIDEDVASLRPLGLLSTQDIQDFYRLTPTAQASTRNQIVTARMYLIDIEYTRYEAALTQELQNEGLAATAASLGLTSTAALIPVHQTSQLLSGIATGVTGLDKAYTEKELLSNTIQALQTEMRADRKTQAAAIYAKMFTTNGTATTITPIDQYTLPMALSDTDHYYDAGTISSALVGLSKTVANANQNADAAKDAVGPNPGQVTAVKSIATPLPSPAVTASIITSATAPLLQVPSSAGVKSRFAAAVDASLCVAQTNETHSAAILDYFKGLGKIDPAATTYTMTNTLGVLLARAVDVVPDCQKAGYLDAFEVGLFGVAPSAQRAANIKALQTNLRSTLSLTEADLPTTGKLDPATRSAVVKGRVKLNLDPQLGGAIDAKFWAKINS